jgi:hypothetical protein
MADHSEFNFAGVLPWATGAMFALIGFFALFVSSRAGGSAMYWIGLGIFALTVLAIFFLIAKASEHS